MPLRRATPADVPLALPMVGTLLDEYAARDPDRFATLPNANAAPERSGAAWKICERSVTLINAVGGRPQGRPGQAAPERRASERC